MIDSLLDSGVTLLELIVRVRNAPEVSVLYFSFLHLINSCIRVWSSVTF